MPFWSAGAVKRTSAAAAGLALGAAACTAMAQNAGPLAPPPPVDARAFLLRQGIGTDRPDEGRQPPARSGDKTFSSGDVAAPYEPFSRGAEDEADRPDDLAPDAETPDEEADAKPRPPKFNLFDGPNGRAAGPVNLAEQPAGASAGGAQSVPGAPGTTAAAKQARLQRKGNGNARRQAGGIFGPAEARGTVDSLAERERNGLPPADLALPASPIRTPRVDTINGRLNLPITGLRRTVAIKRDDPFAPIGLRAGRFTLYSTLDQSVGVSTNLSDGPGGAGGVFSDTVLSARLLSDWSEHELEVNGLAAYRRNFAGEEQSDPRLAVDGRLRLDVDRLTTATLRGAFEYRREDASETGSASLPGSERPELFTYSASAALERQIGRASLGLTGSAVRDETRREASASGGAGPEETYTTATAALRAGYEISPALKPFVEGSIGRRVFDEEADAAGLSRDSLIEALRGGIAFDLGEKFLGEAAVGYAFNVPDAGALELTASPTFDARLAWSPQRGTDIVLSAITSFDPSTDNTGTDTLYESALTVRHRLTARTDLNASVSAGYRDSETASEVERSYGAEAGFTYWLNRTLAFTGLVRHESLDSETAGGDYTADSARIGIKLQR